MKTFIAYRSTGEDPKQIESLLTSVRAALQDKGIEVYCTFFDEDQIIAEKLNKRQIIEHAFAKIDKIDFLFVLQTSENKSEGMLMEIGYCLAKNIPIIAVVKDNVKDSHISDIADSSFSWPDFDRLYQEINNFDFNTLLS